MSSNWALTGAQIAMAFLIMPFTIRTLGQDQYGTWILIASLTGYLSMLTLGIPMSTVHFIAKYSTANAQKDLDRTVGSCAGLYVLMGLAALVVGAGMLTVFHFGYDVSPAFRARADLAFAIVVLNVSAGFLAQLPYGIMGAHHDFVAMNKIRMAGELVRLGLVYGFLSWDASLLWLAVAQAATLAIEFSLALLTVRRTYPRIRIRFRDFDWTMVRQIFSFSAYVFLLHIGTLLVFQTNAIIIGALLPISMIAFFSVPGSLAVYQMQFVLGISGVVMPMATSLHTRGAVDDLKVVFLKWSKITAWLTLAMGAVLIVIGPRLLGWWIEPEFEAQSGPVLQILMIANLFFLPLRGVSLPVLMGMGRPRGPTVGFLIASIANVGISVLLARPFGIVGVALGTAIPNIVYAIYLAVTTCRALGISLRDYASYAFGRPFVGAFPVLAVLCVLRYGFDVQGISQLLASTAAAGVLFAASTLWFVYQRDPHVDLSLWVNRLMRWRRA